MQKSSNYILGKETNYKTNISKYRKDFRFTRILLLTFTYNEVYNEYAKQSR